MRYVVFSIDDSRKHYTDEIRSVLTGPIWEEVEVECVNGNDDKQLARAQAKWDFPIRFEARKGHLGIWYSLLNALEHAPVVTFDDDAILLEDQFEIQFHHRTEELPEDYDFFSLFIPRDSDHMYIPERHNFPGGLTTCKAYQNYGGVSMHFSEAGAQNFLSLVERDGLTAQWDNQIYHYAKHGELKGFTSMPLFQDLVRITGMETSIVQETEIFNAG